MRLLPEIRNLFGNYHVKSGVYHYYRNEYTPAVDFLRKALRDEAQLADSDRRKARHYLTLALMDSAALQIEKGDAERAVSGLRHASEVSPHFPDIHFRLGRLLEGRKEPQEAVEEYNAAIRWPWRIRSFRSAQSRVSCFTAEPGFRPPPCGGLPGGRGRPFGCAGDRSDRNRGPGQA